MKRPAKPEQAYELALGALSRRERTESELVGWLRARGVEETELAEVLARLAEAGALDDAEFARRFAADKRELRGWGPERIEAALRARGVGSAQVEAALAAEGVEEQTGRAAALLAEGGLRCESERERGRAFALLARRGYPAEVAYEAIRAHRGRERGGAGRGLQA